MRKKERKSQFIIVRVTEDEKQKLNREATRNMRSISKHIRVILGIYKPKYENNYLREDTEQEKQ